MKNFKNMEENKKKYKLFTIPATLDKYQSLICRSAKLIFSTQENLTDDDIASMATSVGEYGWLVFLNEQASPNDINEIIKNLPKLQKNDDEKTPSERLRAVLFVYWKKVKKKEGDFELFYRSFIEDIIKKVKEKFD